MQNLLKSDNNGAVFAGVPGSVLHQHLRTHNDGATFKPVTRSDNARASRTTSVSMGVDIRDGKIVRDQDHNQALEKASEQEGMQPRWSAGAAAKKGR